LTGGTVSLLWDAGDATHKRLSYRFTFRDRDESDITMFGLKYVVNEGGADLWSDTTRLYVHLFRGRFSDADAPMQRDLIGCGMLTISIGSFLYQLTTFRGTAGRSGGPLRSIGRFGRFFLRQLWHVYGQPSGPEVLPRYQPPVAVPADVRAAR
jgi:cholesterol oxidase